MASPTKPESGNDVSSPSEPAAKLVLAASANGSAVARTTVVFPLALDENLELYAVKVGMPKGEVIKQVVSHHLEKEGFQPDKRPKGIQVSYE